MGRARAESDSRGRHLRFRLVRRSQRVQLLVRLTALVAIVAALVPRALRETQPKTKRVTWAGTVGRGVVTWIFLVGIVGLPYWIVLIPLHELLLGDELRRHLARSPALWFTFGSLAASHFWKAFRAGYDTMPDKELKQRARWDIYLLILRAIAMFIMAAHGLGFHSRSAHGARAQLSRNLARARSRRCLWRPVAVGGIRSPRSCIEPTPTLTAAAVFKCRQVYFPAAAGAIQARNVGRRSKRFSNWPQRIFWRPTSLSSQPQVAHGVPVKDSISFSLS